MEHFPERRSTTRRGHGHDQNGTVPVADLLRNQSDTRPHERTDTDELDWPQEFDEYGETSGHGRTSESGDPGGHGELDAEPPAADLAREDGLVPEHRSTRVTIALLLLVLLCGATAAISAIISGSHRQPEKAARPGFTPVAGAWTFRPDLLHQARWPFTDENPSGACGSGLAGAKPAPARAITAPLGEVRVDEHLAERTTSEFYALLHTQPDKAMDLLSSDLLGQQRDDILRAWRVITSVRTARLHANSDGSVFAEVALEYADGSHITVWHQLTISPSKRIVGARLLTAHVVRPG